MQHSRAAAWDTSDEAEAFVLGASEPESSSQSQALPVMRSRPIAIRNSNVEQEEDSDDASGHHEDDPDDILLLRTNTVNRRNRSQQHQSLPNRLLLRAPHLGSLPTDEDFMLRHGNIPEFRLPEQDTVDDDDNEKEKPTAYGSLRDSHMQGRFLDQPLLSFRGGGERSTKTATDVSRRRGASSSTSNAISSSAPIYGGLTIGERIQQQRKLQLALSNKINSGGGLVVGSHVSSTSAEADSALPRKSSALALLLEKMEHDPASLQPSMAVASDMDAESSMMQQMDSLALASSVTGLSILQSGLQPRDPQWTAMQKHRSLPPISSKTDAETNVRLSQSFSSPPSSGVPPSFYSPSEGNGVPFAASGFLLPPAGSSNANVHGTLTIESTFGNTPLQATSVAENVMERPTSLFPAHPPPFPIVASMAMDDDGMNDDASEMEEAFDLDMD